jgi:REP element-mobilizing transposase RayT
MSLFSLTLANSIRKMRPRKEHYRRKLPHFQQPGQWYSVTFTLVDAMPKGAMDKYSLNLEVAKNRVQELGLSKVPDFLNSGNQNPGKLEHGLSTVSGSEAACFQATEIEKKGFFPSRESDFPKSDKNFDFPDPDKNFDFGKSKSRGVGLFRPSKEFTQAQKDYQIALRKYRLAYDKILHNSTEATISLIKENNRILIENALLFWEGKRLTNHAWCIMSNHVHWVLSVSKNDENGKPVYLEDILHSVKLFTARRINENEGKTGQFWEHESLDTTIRNEVHFSNVVNYVINNPVAAGLVTDWRAWPGTRVF